MLGQAKNGDGLDSGGKSTEDENGSDSHYIWNSQPMRFADRLKMRKR